MFKNIASDVLGLSDIGAVIKPADYNKVESDDYIIHEEGEKIYFLIKSKTDEYCFTNFALIHLDGDSAVSKKRLLKRYTYSHNEISEVRLETAGTIDLDIEIKFNIGGQSFSIDVAKTHITELKDLYKSLLKIATIQKENKTYFDYAVTSYKTAAETVCRSTNPTSTDEQFKAVNQYVFTWLKNSHDAFVRKNFGDIFEKFINN